MNAAKAKYIADITRAQVACCSHATSETKTFSTMFAINPYEEVSSKCQSSADVCASKGGGEQKAEQKRVNFKYNLL